MIGSTPLVSVIICTRNRKDLVPRAIDSVLTQQSVSTEVIVVDDCSSDGTCESIRERYQDRISLIGLEQNRKVAFATNRGFQASRGEFIALLGDDDYWTDPEKLHKQLAEFDRAGAGLGVVGTWWTEQHPSGELIAREPGTPANWKERLLEGGGVICGSTPLIRREAWNAAGGLDERMPRGTDSDLFRRIVLRGYSGRIIPLHTTVVDVAHGLTRMTATRGFSEARRIAWVHAYILWKYRWYHLRYPKAMLSRIRSLVMGPLVVFLRTIEDMRQRAIVERKSM